MTLDRIAEAAAIGDAARALGLSTDPRLVLRATAYLDLLERWSGTYNLTAIRDRSAMRIQHVNDSLAIAAALLRNWKVHAAPRILDVGSGAGLPGLMVAACCPAATVTCLDAVGKKVAFVAQAIATLGLDNARAVHGRAESHRPPLPYDGVTARAFATLADAVACTRQALGAGGAWALAKGREPSDEIAALPDDVEVFHVERLEVPDLDADRHLVWIRIRGAPAPPAT